MTIRFEIQMCYVCSINAANFITAECDVRQHRVKNASVLFKRKVREVFRKVREEKRALVKSKGVALLTTVK